MPDKQPWAVKEITLFIVAISFVLLLQGAVPFVMIPTLGQAIWSMGFAQSFANGAIFDFYAHDFGIPRPAAIAFGLAGAWPASLLIRLGLDPADAYAGTAACWLTLAMCSAYQIARLFGATRAIALLGAVTWMTMPIIWGHDGYSMLSWGIALLSFYFLACIRLILGAPEKKQVDLTAIFFYFVAAIIAVFMDGYTFMMFAAGSSILLLCSLINQPALRGTLIRVAVPVHFVSFAFAYGLFSVFIGKSHFDPHSIDFFRGWGLDLSFLVVPTEGVHWLPDFLGVSLNRTDRIFFGDASVWSTTFALPVTILGLVSWFRERRNISISSGALLMAAFGFYMALGPSLKINSTKPESLQLSNPGQESALMPASHAIVPTGSAWASASLPGFNVMRASYRWSALSIFGLWLLIVISLSRSNRSTRIIWVLGIVGINIFNVPHLQRRWRYCIGNRDMFQQIDRDLVADLRAHIRPSDTVAFIPWRNDFLANYLAPKVGFRTFNIGGDKNLAAAQASWPAEMLALGGELDAGEALAAAKMLMDGTADVLVFPHFDMLLSAHVWPFVGPRAFQPADVHDDITRTDSYSTFFLEQRIKIKNVLPALRKIPLLDFVESSLFTAVRLRDEEHRSYLLNSRVEDYRHL